MCPPYSSLCQAGDAGAISVELDYNLQQWVVEESNGQEVRVVSQGSSCFTTDQGWPKDATETQGDPPILPTAGPAGSPLLVAEG